MFGSRKTIGAIIKPERAPSTAASPQPSASIQLTRTPTRRAAAGRTAAARIARPTLVNRKKAQRTTTAAIETPIVPRSWSENATPPTRIGRVGNALGNDLISADQIHEAAPLI